MAAAQVNSSKQGFHDREMVFPVGFKTSRKHLSMVDPSAKCLYESEILEKGGKPVFRVTCEHDKDNPVEDSSPNVSHPLPCARGAHRFPNFCLYLGRSLRYAACQAELCAPRRGPAPLYLASPACFAARIEKWRQRTWVRALADPNLLALAAFCSPVLLNSSSYSQHARKRSVLWGTEGISGDRK